MKAIPCSAFRFLGSSSLTPFLLILFLIIARQGWASPDPGGGGDCHEGGPYWSATSNPYIIDFFALPEPGLTNEPMTIEGNVSMADGTHSATFDCQGSLVGQDWPIVSGTMSWSAQSLPSLAPIFSEDGTESAPTGIVGTPAYVTFTPTQAGDQVVLFNVQAFMIDPIASASQVNNPVVVPIAVYPRQRLTYLSLNNSSLAGENGALPLTSDNVSLVPSPFGQGVNFNSSSAISLTYPAFLNDGFPVAQQDGTVNYSTGTPNIRRNEGTVRFWFMPEWSSGNGPSNGGDFFDMFYAGSANWTMIVTNSGSTIQLSAGGTLSVPVNLVSNQWYQITATYNTNQTIIYTNGVQCGSVGPGITGSPFVVIDSFQIGSDGGSAQVRGIMDEVETFNYNLSSTDIYSAYQTALTIDADGDGIPDLVEFQYGIDPANPPGGNPSLPPAPNPGSTIRPVITLLVPINAVAH